MEFCLIWVFPLFSWIHQRGASLFREWVRWICVLIPNQSTSAADIVNHYTREDLADLIYEYGEERFSRKIADAIIAHRPVGSTKDLAEIIERAVGRSAKRIHPATQTFQALEDRCQPGVGLIKDIFTPGPGYIKTRRAVGNHCFSFSRRSNSKTVLSEGKQGLHLPPGDSPLCL